MTLGGLSGVDSVGVAGAVVVGVGAGSGVRISALTIEPTNKIHPATAMIAMVITTRLRRLFRSVRFL